MKNYVLVFLLFFSLSAYSQTDTIPFRKANTVILITKNSDSLNMIEFQRELMKFDYSINKSNVSLHTIETDLHRFKTHKFWSGYSYLFRIQFIDKNIIIKPFWEVGGNNYQGVNIELYRWNFSKSHGDVRNWLWKDLIEVLQDYGGKIEYERK